MKLISEQQNEDISGLQEVCHINNTVVFNFWYFQCLHLMYSEVAWVLLSSGTKVQPQIILELDYLPDYISVSYGYVNINSTSILNVTIKYLIESKRFDAQFF